MPLSGIRANISSSQIPQDKLRIPFSGIRAYFFSACPSESATRAEKGRMWLTLQPRLLFRISYKCRKRDLWVTLPPRLLFRISYKCRKRDLWLTLPPRLPSRISHKSRKRDLWLTLPPRLPSRISHKCRKKENVADFAPMHAFQNQPQVSIKGVCG